jgi:hypothetical protein
MTRIVFSAALCLLMAAQAFGSSGPVVPGAGSLPGGAPVSTADNLPGAAAPVSPAVREKPAARAAEPSKAPEKTAAKSRGPADPGKSGTTIRLKSIECGIDRRGREQVFFTFNRPYRPVLKTLPGEKPRIYFDIPNGTAEPGVASPLDARGPLVRQVRFNLDPTAGTLRVAVELVPEKDYVVRPVLYRKENRFLLEIEPKNTRSRVRP